jgi:hypothetical protein
MKIMQNEDFNKLLPEELRDFHDQKDFFKAFHRHYSQPDAENKIPGNWVDNHIYTMDFFLWFMALHGYRLQRFKSRHFEQYDLNEFVQNDIKERTGQSAKVLNEALHPEKKP